MQSNQFFSLEKEIEYPSLSNKIIFFFYSEFIEKQSVLRRMGSLLMP